MVDWKMVAGLMLVALVGCQKDVEQRFAHLELLPPEKEYVEFSLGDYVVPVPENISDWDSKRTPRNRVQLDFSLSAEIAPEDEPILVALFERHEGKIRNRVIETCRKGRIEDLDEPGYLTLKKRLLDAMHPFLGPDRIRRLVISKIDKFEL